MSEVATTSEPTPIVVHREMVVRGVRVIGILRYKPDKARIESAVEILAVGYTKAVERAGA
jgi:hypothetical protein